MCTYLGGLRGEEVPRILQKHFIKLNEESLNSNVNHVVIPLLGNFKNDGSIARYHLLRIVCRNKSGLDMEKWVRRLFELEGSSRTM